MAEEEKQEWMYFKHVIFIALWLAIELLFSHLSPFKSNCFGTHWFPQFTYKNYQNVQIRASFAIGNKELPGDEKEEKQM